MSSQQKQVQHRALLFTSEDPHMSSAVDELSESLKKLYWVVSTHTIKNSDGKSASDYAEAALAELDGAIQSPDEKIMIYYGGHVMQQGLLQMWTAHSSTCLKHTAQVDGFGIVQTFVQEHTNDFILIFDCPLNLYEHFNADLHRPSMLDSWHPESGMPVSGTTKVIMKPRAEKNVQLVAFPQSFSTLHSCSEDNCQVQDMLVKPQLTSAATNNLAEFLAKCFGREISVHHLLRDMSASASCGPAPPYHRSLLGNAKDFLIYEMLKISTQVETMGSTDTDTGLSLTALEEEEIIEHGRAPRTSFDGLQGSPHSSRISQADSNIRGNSSVASSFDGPSTGDLSIRTAPGHFGGPAISAVDARSQAASFHTGNTAESVVANSEGSEKGESTTQDR